MEPPRVRRSHPTEGALKGVRILALEQAAAGPFCSHLLADLGAEVIKVERPGGGDVIRGWDGIVRGLSSGYVWLNRAKRSVVVDMKTVAGQEVLRRLAAHSDVLLENMGPGVLDRVGLGWEALRRRNRRLIYCKVSGYGMTGPYSDVKSYDLLMQGEAGIMATTGYPDAPAKVGVPIADMAGGMYAAVGISTALYQRERTGFGQLIDVAIFDAMLEWLAYFPHYVWHGVGAPPRSGMRHHAIVPYGPFRARDGRLVSIAVASSDNWECFCRRVLERNDLAEDPRFADTPSRLRHRAEIEGVVERIFLTQDSETWIHRLAAAKLPHGLVNDIDEVLRHEQVAARHLVREVGSPVGPVPTIESPIRMSDSAVAEGPIPSLGGDTERVLQEAGYSTKEIEALRRDGAI
ncbi:MAG: CaiB/BaiF CoA transferase family protein [Solirubrobacterales bacterium]